MDRHLPPLSEDGVAGIRGALHNAVGDLEAWPEALRQVGRAMGAAGVVLGLPNLTPGEDYAYDAVAVGVDFGCAADYALLSRSIDPWSERALVKFGARPGMILLGQDMCPRREVPRSHWYEPVIKPIDSGEVLTGTFRPPDQAPVEVGICVLHRPYSYEAYDADGAARLRLFIDQIAHASRVAFTLRQARRESRILASALDQAGHAVLILGRDGYILFANTAAEHLLRDGSVVIRRSRRLSAKTEPARGRVAAAVAAAVERAVGTDLAVERPGRRRLLLSFTPVPGDAADIMGVAGAMVLVMIRDPEAATTPDAAMIQLAYGLTDAEASIAAEVAAGRTLADIALTRGVSRETIRVQIKSVFAKVGVRRQAELAAALSTFRRGEPTPPST